MMHRALDVQLGGGLACLLPACVWPSRSCVDVQAFGWLAVLVAKHIPCPICRTPYVCRWMENIRDWCVSRQLSLRSIVFPISACAGGWRTSATGACRASCGGATASQPTTSCLKVSAFVGDENVPFYAALVCASFWGRRIPAYYVLLEGGHWLGWPFGGVGLSCSCIAMMPA